MSRLDDLPPDQRAVLLLLVRQGKSHAEIAEMLGISQDVVRDRARAALDALAEKPSAPRSTARAPAPDGGEQARPSRGAQSPAPTALPPPAQTRSGQTRDTGFSSSLPSSRRGGALLLAALVVIVVVAVILITSGGGSHKASSTQSASTTSPSTSKTSTTSSTSTTSGKKPTLDKRIALTSPEPNSKTVGLAEVLSEGSRRAFYIAAEHLPPSSGFFYAVWLYNSPTSSLALGKIPPVNSKGQAQGGALLPANAGDYHEMELTRETNEHATKPGPVVLSGAFSLGGH
ncbi:MAG TPA: sigma factor-like helix-turn-helix DNA-binding protein [Solirubrobacteraceae bacterium]